MVPPDPMPNSEVKRRSADGSVGSPHARVGNCQASNKTKGSVGRLGLSFYLLFVGERSLLESHWLTFGWAFLRLYTSSGRCSPAKKGKVSPPCPFSLKPKRLLRVMQASSLTDSLRSVVRLRRAVSAHSKAVIRLSTESGDNAGKNM